MSTALRPNRSDSWPATSSALNKPTMYDAKITVSIADEKTNCCCQCTYNGVAEFDKTKTTVTIHAAATILPFPVAGRDKDVAIANEGVAAEQLFIFFSWP